MKRKYILYDGRACGGGETAGASVFVVCDSEKEAKSYKGDFGQMACYSYEERGNKLVDEKHEWDYHG